MPKLQMMNKCLLFSTFFCLFNLCLFGYNYTIIMCDVKLGSLNINGARGEIKRASLYSLFQTKKLNVIFLQETHSTPDNETDWKREWSGEAFLSHKSSISGGVGILFSRDFLPFSCTVDEIIPGRLLKVNAEFEKIKMVFINVYAPTVGSERLVFLDVLKKFGHVRKF